MHRLHTIFETIATRWQDTDKIDALYERIALIEDLLAAPAISREQGEHAIHRILAEILATNLGNTSSRARIM